MKAEALAETIAYEYDGEYHDGLEVHISARVDGASIVIKVTPDDGPDQRFRLVVVEIVEDAE